MLRKYKLLTSDGKTFEVDESIALQSVIIKLAAETENQEVVVPLGNVSSRILEMIIQYCAKHAGAAGSSDGAVDPNLRKWDAEFVKVNHTTLFELLRAANYMEIYNLLDLLSEAAANFLKDKSVEEIRELFQIANDFEPGEEDKLRNENPWVFHE